MTQEPPPDPQALFSKGAAFALPLTCIGDRLPDIEKVVGRSLRPRFAMVEGYKLRVIVIPGRVRGVASHTPLLAALEKSADNLAFFSVQINGRLLPLVTTRDARVTIHLPDLVIGATGESPDEHRNVSRTVEMYRPLLEICSRLTGRKIHFHGNRNQIVVPYPIEDEIIHLVPNATPPGERGTQWLQFAFDGRIQKDQEWVSCHRPTRGRGVVVTDTDKNAVVQIVGRTIYTLFPIVSLYHGRESQRIFAEILRASTNHLAREPNGYVPDVPTARVRLKDVLSAFTSHAEDTPRHWKTSLENAEREIGLAQDRLRHWVAVRAEITALKEGYENSERFKRTLARLPEDCRRLLAHPLVERVFGHDGGLHLKTKLLVATHEDRRYALGRFHLRIGIDNKISVWCVESRHPKGIPHPHLLENGVPCFGTATDAILEAGADMRFKDCFLAVIRWLAEGYTPEIGGVAIDEWPLATEAP